MRTCSSQCVSVEVDFMTEVRRLSLRLEGLERFEDVGLFYFFRFVAETVHEYLLVS
jgi:hypothetical protein